jgi:hypothetical protein
MSSARRLAAVATVTIAAAAVVSAVLVVRTPSPQELTKSDAHAAVLTKRTPRSTTTSGARRPRVVPPVFRIVFAALAVTALAHLGVADGLVGRARRRIGDVGESWRALQHGAPPMRA